MQANNRENKQKQHEKRSFHERASKTIKAAKTILWLLGAVVAVILFCALALAVKHVGIELGNIFKI